MPAHNLAERPDLDQRVHAPALYITGLLGSAKPGLAYEGRLQIHNAIGTCSAQQIDGPALPAGSQIFVDQTTMEIVVAWPAYQETTLPLANAGFENGNLSGWTFNYTGGTGTVDLETAYRAEGSYSARFTGGSGLGSEGGIECLAVNNSIGPALPQQRVTASIRGMYNPSGHHFGCRYQARIQWLNSVGGVIGYSRGTEIKGRGNNGNWLQSPVVGFGPPGTAGYRVAAWLTSKGAPTWLDSASWDAATSVGINVETTIGPITIRLIDSAGRAAFWTGIIKVVAGNPIYLSSTNGAGQIYYSDKGLTWSTSDFVTYPSISGNRIVNGFWMLGDVLFISVGNNPYAIFRSTDKGATWTQAAGIPSATKIIDIAKVGGRLIGCATGNDSVYVSDDAGINWSIRTVSAGGGSAFGLAAKGSIAQLSGTSGEVFVSGNGGDSWTRSSPYSPGGSINDIAITPTTFVGISRINNALICVSTDGTAGTLTTVNWPGRSASVATVAVWYDAVNDRVIAALSNGNSIYSTDRGYTWNAGGAIGGVANNTTNCSGWADNGISFVASGGSPGHLFISQNGGLTWTDLFAPAGVGLAAITSSLAP